MEVLEEEEEQAAAAASSMQLGPRGYSPQNLAELLAATKESKSESLLSAHVSISASERNWSGDGQHFHQRAASKEPSVKSNVVAGRSAVGAGGIAHEVVLSLVDHVDEGEGAEGGAQGAAE